MFTAIFSVLSQDIEFGEVSVNYISCGGENTWKQRWVRQSTVPDSIFIWTMLITLKLTQGLSFVYDLTRTDSDDEKNDMLHSALENDGAHLFDALTMRDDEVDLGDQTPLGQYSEQRLQELTSAADSEDSDIGPYKAWFSAHSHIPSNNYWSMFEENAGRRERAYVLWDGERLDSYGLLEAFDQAPEEPEHWNGDEEAMQRSFDERSKIWQKGGWGFWKEGDLSRIEWPQSYLDRKAQEEEIQTNDNS